MDKTALKTFARNSRNKLISAVKQRASKFKITEAGIEEMLNVYDLVIIDDSPLNASARRQYKELTDELNRRSHKTNFKEAFEGIIEEVAYTWFNRLITIRYMEVHGYLPIGMPLLSSSVAGRDYPDAIIHVDQIMSELSLDRQYVWQLQENHDNNELFKYLLIQQSHQLGEMIPSAFEKLGGIEELLLPDNLLSVGSVIDEMLTTTTPTDWQEVEVIGWLYQYYQSEVKERVGGLKNVAVAKRYLPTVTQLFTPKWIVRYMLQNSLGKLYDEKFNGSTLVKTFDYYLKRENNEPLIPQSFDKLEDLRIVDPACGSGNILIEAFNLLYDMYLERGYSPREISRLIIEKNLYGFEIDKRSTQITHISLFLKAVEKNQRVIRRREVFEYHIFEYKDASEQLPDESLQVVLSEEEITLFRLLEAKQQNGKQYGSLIYFNEDYSALYFKLKQFIEEPTEDLFLAATKDDLRKWALPLVEIAYHLSNKYDVVCTNPPYHNKYNPELKKFMNKYYPDTKSDMYSAFIEKCFKSTKENGYAAMMTPMTWMFISSHEKLRRRILENGTISSLVQLEYSAFEDATVPLTTFAIQNQTINKFGKYVDLTEFKGGMEVQDQRIKQGIQNSNETFIHEVNQNEFYIIPGNPIAYWISDETVKAFDNSHRISDVAKTRIGMATANNDKFMRLWHEVESIKLDREAESRNTALSCKKKWFPYAKGGAYRKWYGNLEYIVNWQNDGYEIRNYKDNKTGKVRSHNYNLDYIFKNGITFSAISSSNFSCRKMESSLFGSGGSGVFSSENNNNLLLGYLNSKVAYHFLNILSNTMNYEVNTVGNLPFLINSELAEVSAKTTTCTTISKLDWDAFETSWDFEKHPFLTFKEENESVKESFENWKSEADKNFNQLKANEEELNRIFIDIYGLQDELTPEVEDKDVTIRKADLERDVKSFLSYLVGIIFGRYSLDEPGLVYAGGEFDRSRYKTYQPDQDNVIPLTHENYFHDDIVTRITELVELIYGAETLEENVLFIAQALKMKGDETPRDAIRRYFMKDFFKDHKKIYQNRPIYWQMTSGKQEAFKGIFYLHRYDEATLARVRTEYVLPLTNTLTELANQMQAIVDGSASSREVAKARKEMEKYQKQLQELRDYDLILKNLADQHISLDLDDGVLVNYAKFQDIPVTNARTGKPGKMNLLEKLK